MIRHFSSCQLKPGLRFAPRILGKRPVLGYCSPKSSFLSCTRSLPVRAGWPLQGVQEASLADRGFQIKIYLSVLRAAGKMQSQLHFLQRFSLNSGHFANNIPDPGWHDPVSTAAELLSWWGLVAVRAICCPRPDRFGWLFTHWCEHLALF